MGMTAEADEKSTPRAPPATLSILNKVTRTLPFLVSPLPRSPEPADGASQEPAFGFRQSLPKDLGYRYI